MPNPTIDRTDEGPRAPTLKKRRRPTTKARVTRQTLLIRMLRAPTGLGVATICIKLGWQAHTTRAALSRLRQAGFLIVREQSSNDKPARYRIVSTSGCDGVSMRNDPVDSHSETARLLAAPHNALELKVAAPEGMETRSAGHFGQKTWGRGAPTGARQRFLIHGVDRHARLPPVWSAPLEADRMAELN